MQMPSHNLVSLPCISGRTVKLFVMLMNIGWQEVRQGVEECRIVSITKITIISWCTIPLTSKVIWPDKVIDSIFDP